MLYVTPVITWCIVQDDFELMEIPLLEPPKCWDYRHMSSKLVWWVSLVRGLVIGFRVPLVFCRLSFSQQVAVIGSRIHSLEEVGRWDYH